MTLSKHLLIAGSAVALLAAGAAKADEKTTTGQCADLFDQCIVQCQTDHKDDAARHAPCVTACSGKYAACDAGGAYEQAKPWLEEQAKPWLEEQAKKTKRFFDDLIDKYGDGPPAPDPQTKNRDNSI